MYYHPKDTVKIVQNRSDRSYDHLWYDVHYFQQKDHRKSESKERLYPLREKVTLSPTQRAIWSRARKRRLESLALFSRKAHVQILRAVPTDAWAHGLGAAHIRESSLTLHPVYGIPYLPGSSVKGIVYHWALHAFFEGDEKDCLTASKNSGEQGDVARVIIDMFGTQDVAGSIQFHDAFASDELVLKPDVLTVHYKKYYEGKVPPTDTHSPIPHDFYVVEAPAVEFVLTHNPVIKSRKSTLTDHELLEVAGSWLQRALTETGIGAKTTSGYGYFREFRDCTDEILADITRTLEQQETARRAREEEKKRAAEEQRRQDELEKALSQMTEGERMAYRIKTLTDNEEDQERSKTALYEQVVQLAVQGELEPVKALREYWERTGNWNVKKKQKKQFDKVTKLKQLLEESPGQ